VTSPVGVPIAPRPCSAREAVERALSLVGQAGSTCSALAPTTPSDLPWTRDPAGQLGTDCAGFAISWCYKLPRHRQGFNAGPRATVSDDLNCNSAIEDADHKRELFERVFTP
jgi:hypothetical protein